MNSFTCIARLGADPETIQLGDREGRKVRLAEEVPGKKNITRWFNAIFSGRDVETVDRIRKGDTIMVTGALALTEYSPKKTRYKGEKVKSDEMPFAKLMQVIKSPSFFEGDAADAAEEAQADGVTATEDPISGAAVSPDEDPLA